MIFPAARMDRRARQSGSLPIAGFRVRARERLHGRCAARQQAREDLEYRHFTATRPPRDYVLYSSRVTISSDNTCPLKIPNASDDIVHVQFLIKKQPLPLAGAAEVENRNSVPVPSGRTFAGAPCIA